MDNKTQQNLDEGWRDILGSAQFKLKDILGKERTRGIGRAVGSAGEKISTTGEKIASAITKLTGGAAKGLKTAESHISQDPLETLNALTGQEFSYVGKPSGTETHHWSEDATADEMRRHQIEQLRHMASGGKKGRESSGSRRAIHAAEFLNDFNDIPERELRFHGEDSETSGKKAGEAAIEEYRKAQEGKKSRLSDAEKAAKEAMVFEKASKKAAVAHDKENRPAILSKLLGTLAFRAALFSEKEKEARADKEDTLVRRHGHEAVAGFDPVRFSQEFESHHGGHGHMGEHPVAREYRSFFEKQGDHTLPHPDELFDISKTAHVQDEFSEFLPDELRKHNAKTSRAFKASADIANSLMKSAGPTISQQSVPFKMMESKQYNPLLGRTKDVYAMRYGGFPRQING